MTEYYPSVSRKFNSVDELKDFLQKGFNPYMDELKKQPTTFQFPMLSYDIDCELEYLIRQFENGFKVIQFTEVERLEKIAYEDEVFINTTIMFHMTKDINTHMDEDHMDDCDIIEVTLSRAEEPGTINEVLDTVFEEIRKEGI